MTGGKYSNSLYITESYYSSIAGDCIQFDLITFDTEANFDDLTIYDGINISARLIGVFDRPV